ncbi:MAG TPA: thiamine pyrophosphate-dependent enzyme [Alphaproteobacteria bacterium]|nr:thiamine pyrophosphate-dependent enzyme [Alphaproteobacteria bacterium]
MPMMTGADSLVRSLLAHGLETVYCLPGVQNDHFFNAIFDAGGKPRAVHTRHEQGAAYMALGAALATGRPAAYSVVPGPGLLNTTAALSSAYATNARVLCLTGQIPSRAIDRGWGQLHEIPDQLGIIRHLTKWANRIATPAEAAPKVAAAFQQLASGRPRPVGLEIPPDILAAKADLDPVAPLPPLPLPPVDGKALERAIALLEKAERPLIFVGSGALDAAAEVRAIAEHLQAPVISYRLGRGVLDDRHLLAHNITAGHKLWRDCDVVLGIGTRLHMGQLAWGVDDKLKIIRIDVDPEEISRIRTPDVALIGDARTVLTQLLGELRRKPPHASRAAEMQALKAEIGRMLSILEPQLSYVAAIRQVLPENGIVVDDLTQMNYVSRIALPVYRPRTYLNSGYQGTLGAGFATALGAQDADHDVPVVSICGDGGFLFTATELATAVRHKIPLVTVVFNDNAYGNVRRMQEDRYGNRVIASDLTNPDFPRMAESFGITGLRARTPEELRTALEKTLAARAPALIEVPCGPMPDPFRFMELPKVRGA